MIPEIGQFALIIALLLALTQATLPLIGASRGNRTWIALAAPAGQAQFIFVAIAFCCLGIFIHHQRLLRSQRRYQLQFTTAAALPARRNLGLARRFVAVVDVDARALDGRRFALQPAPAGRDGRARAERDGHRQRRFSVVHVAHFESVCARCFRRRRMDAI